jgi:Family of unknown function (DUF6204)
VAIERVTSERVYRVTVRGRFRELSDEARRYLTRAQAEHDIFVSAFTPEGTFTYDARLAFFNLRYEIRSAADGANSATQPADPATTALAESELFLRTMGFGYSHLRTDVVDATSIWDDAARRTRAADS